MPVDDGGCGWYRTRQPFEFIKREGQETYIIDQNRDNMIEVAKAMGVADIVVMRQGAEGGRNMMVNTVNKYLESVGSKKLMDAKWVMDIDDNIEIISPYSNHYEEYGTKEIIHDGKYLWKDGENNFDISRNKNKVESLLRGMANADLVTVTTEKLAQYARNYNMNVAVLPNGINLDRWWKLPFKDNEQLRVGWSGGSSHYEDWYSIKEPLNQLMREKQFKLVVVGNSFKGVINKDLWHLVEEHDWVPFKGHSYRMMCMNLDIAIIPLADIPFNHYKSSIKWYEMSAMGVPSLVSNVLPYSEDFVSGSNAIIYNNTKMFYNNLKLMLENKPLRHRIGLEARKWVEDNRDMRKLAKQYIEAYGSLRSTK